mgnify:FL=1
MDPLPEGMLVKRKFNTGGVAEEETVELANNAKLEALTVAVEDNATVNSPPEMEVRVGG